MIGADEGKYFQIRAQLPPEEKMELVDFLKSNADFFAWRAYDALRIDPGAESGGVERGHLPPLTCPIFFLYIYIYIYIYFMCVVVKGGDLIEIVINSA